MTSDQFHYRYKSVKGDAKIEILVNNFVGADQWAKGGLMIRETLDPGSKHFSLFLSGSNGMQNLWRPNTNGSSDQSQPGVPDKNIWLRIERKGNEFQAYYKRVGTASWVQAGGKQTIQMSSDVYVGIAVTSHDNSKLAALTGSAVDLCDEPDIDIGNVGVTGTFEKALAGDIITGSGAGELQSSSGVIRPK
jgi:regulation of enolase protein 1 (concanavalin A-like superfamily)